MSLQDNLVFLTKRIDQKTPQMSPCSTQAECHFGQVNLDPTIFTRSFWWSFWLVFFIGFFTSQQYFDSN